MPNEDNKIIKYNQGEKSIKLQFIIYADLECLNIHHLVIHYLHIAH